MRLLMVLTVVFFVVALICTLVPTAVLTVGWQGWLTGGLIAWAVDVLLGGVVTPTVVRRQQ